MATPKQEKLVQKIAENIRLDKPRSMGALMLESGYAKGTAIRPSVITKTNNFIELLEKNGVTDKRICNAVKGALVAMNGRKADHTIRLQAARFGAQLKGHLKEADNGGLESIGQLVASLKGVDVQVLMVIKSKLHTSEPIDVTGNS